MLAELNASSLAFVHVDLFAFDVPSNIPALPFSSGKVLCHFLLLSKAVNMALFYDIVIGIYIKFS